MRLPVFFLLLASPVLADDTVPPLFLVNGLPHHEECNRAVELIALVGVDIQAGEKRKVLELRGYIWSQAAAATDQEKSQYARRVALGELIQYAGWRSVLTGELPSPVPLDWYPVKGD